MSRARAVFTSECDFYPVPVIGKSVFAVKEGIPADIAISTARALIESLLAMSQQGVQDGISSTGAHAMVMLTEMLDGLVGSLEGQL